MTNVGVLQQIWRYPVKSMRGERVDHAAIGRNGVAGDRRWAVRDVESGKVASAKQPRPWAKLLECTARYHGDPQADAVVMLPDGRELASDDERLDGALGDLVGRDVRVEAATGGAAVYESYWPEVDGVALSDVTVDLPIALGKEVPSFVDLAALHLVTTGSLGHFEELLTEAHLDVARFRPNLVIETSETGTFDDTEWVGQELRIGDEVRVSVDLATPRCIMTTLPQPGLERAPSVLQTLARTNRMTTGLGTFACFGVYAEVRAVGEVHVGDEVSVA